MRKFVVSDSSIFVDLIKMGLLDDFFLLPFDISTVDFVIRELKKAGQVDAVLEFETRKKLTLIKFSEPEIEDIYNLKIATGGYVSFQDCSVLFCASQKTAIILTEDRALTLKARSYLIDGYGLLYVLNLIVSYNIVPSSVVADKLEELAKENKMLPEMTVNELILKWRSLTSNNDKEM